ncbi:unnamed protein product [Thlaspi arvense]|uniref:GH18 domain-containing protein n=1 Tax=Thlaspi arvense TaxID=13288 RepID=A0AAU9T5G0_THLAR|nr:unnamed protein product [Thlaspi arvense]
MILLTNRDSSRLSLIHHVLPMEKVLLLEPSFSILNLSAPDALTDESYYHSQQFVEMRTFKELEIDSALFTHVFCAFADLNSQTNQVTVSSANQPKFSTFTQTISLTRLYLDWEYPSSATEMSNLGTLLREWRSAFAAEASSSGRQRLLLAAAVFYSNNYYSILYLVQAAAASLDWVNLMAYDFYRRGWSRVTGPPAALNDPSNAAHPSMYNTSTHQANTFDSKSEKKGSLVRLQLVSRESNSASTCLDIAFGLKRSLEVILRSLDNWLQQGLEMEEEYVSLLMHCYAQNCTGAKMSEDCIQLDLHEFLGLSHHAMSISIHVSVPNSFINDMLPQNNPYAWSKPPCRWGSRFSLGTCRRNSPRLDKLPVSWDLPEIIQKFHIRNINNISTLIWKRKTEWVFITIYYCQDQPCVRELSECVVFINLLHHSQLFLCICASL